MNWAIEALNAELERLASRKKEALSSENPTEIKAFLAMGIDACINDVETALRRLAVPVKSGYGVDKYGLKSLDVGNSVTIGPYSRSRSQSISGLISSAKNRWAKGRQFSQSKVGENIVVTRTA